MIKKPLILPTLSEIQAMVEQRPKTITLLMIAVASGSTLDWIYRFLRNEIPNPGYQRVSAIYEYLRRQTKTKRKH